MPVLLARLYRMVPLIVLLVLLGVAVFVFVATRHNSERAKEAVLKLFWWVCAVLTGLALLGALYAWFDGSELVFDLFLTSAALTGIGWLVDLICGAIFRKHHPKYRLTPTTPKAKVK